MLFAYLVVLFVGLGQFSLVAVLLLNREHDELNYLITIFAGVGLGVSGYSAVQIARPMPRSKPEFERDQSNEEADT